MPHEGSIIAPQSTCSSCCGSDAKIPNPAAKSGVGRSFRVAGLDCAEEVAVLNKVLAKDLGGEDHLAFDVINARMTILDSAIPMQDDEVIRRVASTGLSAKQWDDQSAKADHSAHLKRQKQFTFLSAGFWAAGLIYHMIKTGLVGGLSIFSGHGNIPMPNIEISLFLLAILFGAWLVAPKAWSSARRLSPDMNLLMIVAVCGAVILGEFFEAATVAFLFALSLTLESWSVGRARNAVAALLDLAPATARVISKDGKTEQDIPAAQVAIGDIFIVRGGDRIPLDGTVQSGIGAVDQAPITGESAMVLKEAGDTVFAGTINGEGTLTIQASNIASDTVLAKITRMVGDAHSRRADIEQWVTKFARIYTPFVMGLAAFIAIVPPLVFGAAWTDWIYNALVLLVIACPCALVISTPVSIVAALAASARNGVLIKGGAYVEIPSRLTALAIDKTGTITEGTPEIASVQSFIEDDASLLQIAAALEIRSSHPLARAIVAYAGQTAPAEQTRTVPGRGVEGIVDGRNVWLGSERFAHEKGLEIPDALKRQFETAGSTLVAIGDDTNLLGLLELRDKIRPDARAMISKLHAQGVKKIVMLTGDNEPTARAVAQTVGIDEVHAGLLPQEKVAAIEELTETYDVVAMVGDGVNDAPAMARADIAIAMGAVGSDSAIETADIALMSDDIGKLPWLVNHSRHTMTIIRQNIGFALATKALFAGLTALGMASMWGAIAADVGVSLAVVANALRLLRER
ncbi:heavy metal translocating P-type ATPase [Ruegeria litorea]|uniref:P-type Zn(2+) transporter n=1 Tax=Falsiruegeria litorea TaxID=1280831 RepID=A0ABS5WTI0_9RHOB|nr:cation-translocating P-type ATPase [Falsiruegeria litorea]MBT3142380.1 heavy metal translocating P-type ATPase [Falsiruegeria litorea]